MDIILNHLRSEITNIPADLATSLKPVSSLADRAPFFALHPANETSAPNNHDNRVIQTETVTFAVFTVCLLTELGGIRKKLKTKMRGLQPNADAGMVEHVSGQIEDIQGKYVWYKDFFKYEETSE